MSRALIYVPVYDQARELPRVLEEIDQAELEEVDFLLFDNGSKDGSGELVRRSRHASLAIPRNRGVGYSYIRSLDWALERRYAWFGAMAANGKMLAGEIPRLLGPLREGRADYVTGSRFLAPGHAPNLPAFRRATIPAVSMAVRVLTGASLTDVTNGFRAFRLDLLRRARFDWHADWLHTYAFEYYLYAKVLLDPRLRAMEVPTTMRYPKAGRYSHIRPGVDWYAMLKPWVVARVDGKGFE